MTKRIAMWSGPRTISTALMRSWENRPDCRVVDEPFYACYLSETGLEHPCRKEILQAQSSDRNWVIQQLTDVAPATDYFFQKHMTHHMPRGTDMSWSTHMRHFFLIRDPAEVIASYLDKMPSVTADAIGIVRQSELFEVIEVLTGERPVVIDCSDVLRDPGSILRQLCEQLEVPFLEECMLKWPAGQRGSDGVWARHWYQSVEESTGFASHSPGQVSLAPEHQALADKMQGYYQQMAEHRLRP
jgi:hypothetical protein